MSRRGRSRSLFRVVEVISEAVEPEVAQPPSDDQPPQAESPTESQGTTPKQDNEDEGAPKVQGPDPGDALQEAAQQKTDHESVKGEDVKQEVSQKHESIPVPEAENGHPQV